MEVSDRRSGRRPRGNRADLIRAAPAAGVIGWRLVPVVEDTGEAHVARPMGRSG